jgi:hypothetical protein
MKRVVLMVVSALICGVVFFSSCDKASAGKGEMPILGIYTSDDGLTQVALNANNRFYISGRPEISFRPDGTYSVNGSEIIMNGGGQLFLFSHENGKLTFRSGTWLENWINPGTVLKLSKTK